MTVTVGAPMPFATVELDLRRAKRYVVNAVVSFCWDPGNGALREGRGTTLDISSRGVFVTTAVVPQAGVQLELDIDLRSLTPEWKPLRFHGEGKVVRTIERGLDSGFAAEVLFQTETSEATFSAYHSRIQ
jgi:hypothetical protein